MDEVQAVEVSVAVKRVNDALAELKAVLDRVGASSMQVRMVDNASQAVTSLVRSIRSVESA